jgi:hypothetical protein
MRWMVELFTKHGAWAPLLVLLMHRMVYWLGVRQHFDWLMHYSGGVAATFFFWKLLCRWGYIIGQLNPLGRLWVAFTMGCTIAVYWEIIEFAVDFVTGSHIQHSIKETMKDLVYGTCGALTTCLGVVLFAKNGIRNSTSNPP